MACFLAVVAYVGTMVTLFFGMVRAAATKALALHLFQEIRAAWSLLSRLPLSATLLLTRGVDVHWHRLCAMRLGAGLVEGLTLLLCLALS